MEKNYTADTIYLLLCDKISDSKIKVVKDNFPGPKNSIEYARILVKCDDRVLTFELLNSVLKDLNISFKVQNIRGSTFNCLVIDDYYKIGKKEKNIRIFFKYADGKDFKNYYIWNSLLEQVFKKDISLKRTPRDRTEVTVLKKINKKIEELGDNMPVTIYIRNKKFLNVAGFVGGIGTRKSDFVIVNYDAEEIGFLSYKVGSTANDFQQYGGVSDLAGTKISNHPEVLDFKSVVIDNWTTYKNDYASVWRDIDSNNLKKQSVFGKNYIRKSGHDSVDFFVQGTPKFLFNSGILYLTFSAKMVRKGDLSKLQGDYEPVLGVRAGERSRKIKVKNKSIYGVRAGIWSRSYITNRRNKEI